MPISSEALKQDLDRLTNEQLQQVVDFIDFLKFRDQRRHKIVIDPTSKVYSKIFCIPRSCHWAIAYKIVCLK